MSASAVPGSSLAALLLLADSRVPTGAHAHSAGLEASHRCGAIGTVADLAAFVDGRLATSAPVEAAFAAAAAAAAIGGDVARLAVLDHELAIRTVSPRLRAVSRTLGRQLLRPAEQAWPSPVHAVVRGLHPEGPTQPVAVGTVAAAAGLDAHAAALCSLHHLVGTVTSAAVRLLGLDPFAVHALAARLAPRLDALAARAVNEAAAEPADLPSTASLLADALAEHHATWEVRLFAS